MNQAKMIADAYGHFLEVSDDENDRKVFFHFATEELNLPEKEAAAFSRKVMIENEGEINSPEFDQFYTWYYLNYVMEIQTHLVRQEVNLRNTIIKAPVAMGLYRGPRHVVEIVNDRMLELWGKTMEDVLNKPVFEGLPEARNQGFEQLLDGVFTTGETVVAQGIPVTLRRGKELAIVFVNFVYEAYREPDGAISGIINVATDVTDQILARQKIEEVVKDRTRELAETNKKLEKSNEELTQFAFIASHDLQEPVRKVRIFAEMLAKRLGDLDPQSRNYLEKINTSVVRMSSLIRDVLAYSELSGKVKVYEPVDLQRVVDEIVSDFELLIEEKKAKIIYSELPVVEAVPLQMFQLIRNLLSNALKFTHPDRAPVISITAETASAGSVSDRPFGAGPFVVTAGSRHFQPGTGHSYCQIEIKDNGIGFGEEQAEKIFSIFQRLHGRDKYPGTGIGLALCRKIVQNHQGEIYANSETGQGATFRVILPLKQ
jgi:signal transduction histidine kinase